VIAAWAILAAVVVQRLVEVAYASRNAAALVRAGGVEVGRGHYPAMVVLHTAWLAAIAVGIARRPELHPAALVAYAALQPLRVWTIATLGRFWTTRVITVKDVPLVRRGPYRYLRHPNYVVVVGEVVLLPLGFGQVVTAAVFSAANLALLAWRVRIEQTALAPRVSMPGR
jgi:methyltransferase